MLVVSVATTVVGAAGVGKALAYTVNGARKVAKVGGATAKGAKAFVGFAIKARNASRAVSTTRKIKLAYAKIKPGVDKISALNKVYTAVNKEVAIANKVYEMATRDAIVEDFGADIDNLLKSKFNKTAFNQIAEMWAKLKFNKFAANLDIDIACQALEAVSLAGLADPTGIVSGVADVALAFTKPICASSANFPTLSKNYK
jgi:hypothetical protein